MKDDEADKERRRLSTLPLVEAFEKLIEDDQRSDLKRAREFVVGALLVSCSPRYREIVRTPGSDLETGDLDGELLLGGRRRSPLGDPDARGRGLRGGGRHDPGGGGGCAREAPPGH